MTAIAQALTSIVLPKRREFTAGQVDWMNTLVGEHREFLFTWAGKPARLQFVPVAQSSTARGWLRCRIGDHSLDLGLPALPEPSSLGARFAGIELSLLPEELLLGVLEVWLEDPLAAAQAQGVGIQLEAWQTNTPPPAMATCGWEIRWDGRERFAAGTLHAEPAALAYLADLTNRTAPVPRRLADSIPFPVSVAFARVPLRLDAAAALNPGDVVLLPMTPADLTAGKCELWTAEHMLGRAVRQKSKVKVVTMNSAIDVPSSPLAPSDRPLDHLPIQVGFDVGQIQLTVGQLRTLGEGYTFELPEATDRLVTIRANGREIGRGELVEVGDKVGVRIITWELA